MRGGVLQIKGTFLVVPIIRIVGFWVSIGFPYLGKLPNASYRFRWKVGGSFAMTSENIIPTSKGHAGYCPPVGICKDVYI